MYRFRKIKHLLGTYQELENQEIYFASPEELNDPMEGLRDIFWKGDAIVWKRLLINYTKSLDRLFFLNILQVSGQHINEEQIAVMQELLGFPTPIKKQVFDQVLEKVFSVKQINDLPEALAKRINPVRKNELIMYLRTIHAFVINAISDAYFENGLSPKDLFKKNTDSFPKITEKFENLPSMINQMESENPESSVEKYFSITNIYADAVFVSNQFEQSESSSQKNIRFLMTEFPEKFVSKLEQSIFPPWYTASFLSDCSNSAVWGHYGDNHRGVCLKFRTKENNGQQEIQLETEYGISGNPAMSKPTIGMRPHAFRKIEYHNKHTEIDFFRSIGRMPKFALNALWYNDEAGNTSVCGEHLAVDKEEEWGKQYWNKYLAGLSIKLKEWEYEQEYRLIVHGDFIDYSDFKKRKLKYDFTDLEAIIFGIKTEKQDKLRIMKIINNKCKQANRTEFDFYQAYYASDSGKIEIFKLDMLNLKEKK